DNRQYRDRQACSNRPGSTIVMPADCDIWNDPRRTFLGQAQEQWLDAALAQSAKRAPQGWTIIGHQTLFGRRDSLNGPGELLWNDGWDGYPAARRRLTESLQRHRSPNVVMIGGDVHQNWVGHIKSDY